MTSLRLSLVVLALLAACAASPAAAQAAPAGADLKAACEEARGEDYRLFLSPEVTRQGVALRVTAVVRGPEAPWGAPVPIPCLEDWTVSDAGAATLSAEHDRLVIAEDAVPGTKVRLTARINGKTAAAEFVVVARNDVVLTGYWTEVGDAQCPASAPPLRELRLKADGGFEATWMPFESYVDYWGTYSFDPSTGAITLTATGGNRVPTNADLTGEAALGQDGLLRFAGLFFGSPPGAAPAPTGCVMTFKSR